MLRPLPNGDVAPRAGGSHKLVTVPVGAHHADSNGHVRAHEDGEIGHSRPSLHPSICLTRANRIPRKITYTYHYIQRHQKHHGGTAE